MHPDKEKKLLEYMNPNRMDESGKRAQYKFEYEGRTCWLLTVPRRSFEEINEFGRLVEELKRDLAHPKKDKKQKKA